MSVYGSIACDWDGVLVDDKQEWLPGALEGLRALLKSGRMVTIHSCRMNWPEGRAQINDKLHAHGFTKDLLSGRMRLWAGEGKPIATVYLDDRGYRFETWDHLVHTLKEMTTL